MANSGEVTLDVKLMATSSNPLLKGRSSLSPCDEAVLLQDCNLAIFRNLTTDVILGVKSLQALQFRMRKNSIQVGPAELLVCSVGPSEESEKMVLRDSIQHGETRWDLYVIGPGENHQSIFEPREAVSEPRLSKKSEMQASLLLQFSKGDSIPDMILRSEEIDPPRINMSFNQTSIVLH